MTFFFDALLRLPTGTVIKWTTSHIRKLRRRRRAWFALALAAGLLACSPTTPKPMTAGITGYNFTAEGVQEYYVNGMRGSNLPPYGGGGSTSCCVSLPAKWTPGLTVKVSWTIGDYTLPWSKLEPMTPEQRSACCWRQRTRSKLVPVERYAQDGGRLQVFFLANDAVHVWVSNIGLLSSEHPSHMGYPKKPDTTD
ncbi:DUF3304 domain-containing protein [Variovorax boronicumulans]|uniref:DUF3304 domain-containing protein n=1 Tax=Variovorax boronicumulans TaxID=436515 RepID=UPI0033962EE2